MGLRTVGINSEGVIMGLMTVEVHSEVCNNGIKDCGDKL